MGSSYRASTGYPAIDMLVSRGGMESMLDTIWLIITALAFGGVIENCAAIRKACSPITTQAMAITVRPIRAPASISELALRVPGRAGPGRASSTLNRATSTVAPAYMTSAR